MKQTLLLISASLLTFIVGISLVFSCHALSKHRVKMAREVELRKELSLMRGVIHQYEQDKGSTPESLKQLVATGYLVEIPIDPITGERDWTESVVRSGCIHKMDVVFIDVSSTSANISSEGIPYSQW